MLTDETFAIFKNLGLKDASDRSFVFTWLNILSWSYWAAGTLLGAILGDFIKADTKGLEFSLTALFIVIVIEMFKNDKNYRVLFAATFFGVLGVSLFPAKFVLVGSMALCFIFLLLFKIKFDKCKLKRDGTFCGGTFKCYSYFYNESNAVLCTEKL